MDFWSSALRKSATPQVGYSIGFFFLPVLLDDYHYYEMPASITCTTCISKRGICDQCKAIADSGVESIGMEADDQAKLDRLATIKKREISIATPTQSPSHSPVVEPAISKARAEAPLPDIPGFPKMAPHSDRPPVVPTVPAPVDPVLVAITKLTVEMHTMRLEGATKQDLAVMATKADLQELRKGMREETRQLISDAVHPLKEEISDVRTRMDAQDARVDAQGGLPSSSSTISPEVKQIIDALDPAHKQIVFGGFSENVPQSERAEMISKYPSSIQNIPVIRNQGGIMKGPKANRVLTRLSFIEYSSVDDARNALKILKQHPFTLAGATLSVKSALTKVNASRNWALKEADKMAKTLEASKSANVSIDWTNRCVKVGTDIIFSQTKDDLKGTFCGMAGHLKLP